MNIPRIIRPAAMAAALAWSVPAQAAEGPEAPMSTAGGSGLAPSVASAAPVAATPISAPPERTTAQQIEDFLRSSPAAASDIDGPAPPRLDRGVHGEVSVGVGTHGYRSASVRAQMPLGQSGWLSIAVGESRGPWLAAPCRVFADGAGWPDDVGLPGPGGCRRGGWLGPIGEP